MIAKTLEVVVGTPPTGQVGAESSPTTVDENTGVRFLADGFATDGDPITVEGVTCEGVLVPSPIITTLAGEQKLVGFNCTTPDGPSTITASVTFRDFDGELTVMATLPVVNVPCVDSSQCDEGLFCEESGECVPVRAVAPAISRAGLDFQRICQLTRHIRSCKSSGST
jgi:hypothetical protein